MAPPKLYLDENMDPALAHALRKRGFDVIHTQEAGRSGRGIPDEAQLQFAAAQGRAIVTFNLVEFKQLAVRWLQEGREHWGIIVSPQRSFRETQRRLIRLLNDNEAEDLKNQLRYL
jgi:type II secretory pathway component PulK